MVTSYVGVEVVLSTCATAVPDTASPGMLTVRAPAMSPDTLAPVELRTTATDPDAANETRPAAPGDSWALVIVTVVVDEVVVTATLPDNRTGPTARTPEPATVTVVAPAVQLAVALPLNVTPVAVVDSDAVRPLAARPAEVCVSVPATPVSEITEPTVSDPVAIVSRSAVAELRSTVTSAVNVPPATLSAAPVRDTRR